MYIFYIFFLYVYLFINIIMDKQLKMKQNAKWLMIKTYAIALIITLVIC